MEDPPHVPQLAAQMSRILLELPGPFHEIAYGEGGLVELTWHLRLGTTTGTVGGGYGEYWLASCLR
jgi:hypothetical protein